MSTTKDITKQNKINCHMTICHNWAEFKGGNDHLGQNKLRKLPQAKKHLSQAVRKGGSTQNEEEHSDPFCTPVLTALTLFKKATLEEGCGPDIFYQH